MSVKPCDEDLIEVANFLRDTPRAYEIYGAASRVAPYLNELATGDRAMARKLGCRVGYYRKYIKPGAAG